MWTPRRPSSSRDVVRGRRIEFPWGTADQSAVIVDQQLPEPGLWEVTLSPIHFMPGADVYSATLLQPAKVFDAAGAVSLTYTLTWGGGGAVIGTDGRWPMVGRSFTISADSLRIVARAIGMDGPADVTGISLTAWAVPVAAHALPWFTEAQYRQLITTPPGPLSAVEPVPWGARHLYWWGQQSGFGTPITIRYLRENGSVIAPPIVRDSAPSEDLQEWRRAPVPADARGVQFSVLGSELETIIDLGFLWECSFA